MVVIGADKKKRKKKGTTKLNRQEVAIFRLIGMAIADQPKALKNLLKKHGFKPQSKMKASELSDMLIQAISTQSDAFNLELGQILTNQEVPDEYDNFDFKGLMGAAAGTDVTVGADPASAIAGAVGSIFSFAGNVSNRKVQKEQARNEALQSMMMMRNQQQQLAAQQQIQAAASKAKNANIKTIGMIAGVVVMGGLILWGMNQSPQPQIAATT